MPETSDNGELLRFLVASVESIRIPVDRIDERMATKDDIAAVRGEFTAVRVEITAARGDIERVDLRLDGIDRALTTRLDTMDLSISRLRSAVYLLGKDQPDVLKLLGPT